MWRRILDVFPVLGFWLSLAILMAVGSLAYRNVAGLVEMNRWVEHTHEVIDTLNDVFLLVRDASSARRGYSLSGDPAELIPYERARDQLVAKRATLRGLVADNEVQARRDGELDLLLDERMSRLEQSIAYHQAHGFDRQHEDAFLAEARKATNVVRELVGLMVAEERRLQREREAAERGSAVSTGRVLLAGAVLSVGLLAIAFSAVRRENRARRQTEVVLTEAKESAEAAVRELEAFSYSVAHDLRTPLRGIDGFSLALLEDCGDRLDEESLDHLRRVRAAAQRMGTLIDDLLDLSRVTRREIRREAVNLTALSREVLGRLARENPERRVAVAIQEGLVAHADPRLMSILFDNLLANAWKFTSGTVGARIEVGQSVDGDQAFHVRDNGAGFDMAYSAKLFGAFQRLHREADFPGTGIGLATVQRIVQRHRGRIWAHGEVDRGATFCFTFGH